jgi:hypothetical protein
MNSIMKPSFYVEFSTSSHELLIVDVKVVSACTIRIFFSTRSHDMFHMGFCVNSMYPSMVI